MPRTGKTAAHAIVGLLFVLFTVTPVQAQATASNFTFGQIDWYSEDGLLICPDSSWGTFEFDLITDPVAMHFLNVTADAGLGPAWIVENMPLPPDAVRGTRSGRYGADFDITQLGLPAGTDLTSLGFDYTVTRNPSLTPPAGVLTGVPVQTVVRNSFGSRLPGDPLPADMGVPYGIHTGFAAKAWSGWPRFIHHDGVPGVQEGTDMCLPGSLARSIKWLDSKYKLNMGKTAQQIYQDLAAFDNPTRLSYEDFMAKKAKYLEDHSKRKGETKILDVSGIIGPVDGVDEETGTDVLDWLLREFPTEDVELHYDNHIITVTSVFSLGSKAYIGYRDDETQNDNGAGDTGRKLGRLSKNADGTYSFRTDGKTFEVKALVSESISTAVVVNSTAPWTEEAFIRWENVLTGETLSDIVFGDLGMLRESGGDFALATVGCYANDVPGTEIPLLITGGGPGNGIWLLQRSTNVGGPGSWDAVGHGQVGSRDDELAGHPMSCPACAHDLCVEGEPLDRACNWCVDMTCAAAPWCCDEVWDEVCIRQVQGTCGSLRCAASRGWCEHTLCSEGEPLLPGCDDVPPFSCVEKICLIQPECCIEEWHDGCIWAVETECGMGCF
jgi:hypothetical protein